MARHQGRARLSPRGLLGPIRSGPDPWEPAYDPFDLQDRQPANTVVDPSAEIAVAQEPTRAALPSTTVKVPRSRSLRELVRLAEMCALAFTAVTLMATARVAETTTAEAARVLRVIAAARPDIGAMPGAWSQRLFEAFIAGWLSATSALSRYGDAVAAVREPMIVVGVAVFSVLWLISWRLRLAAPTRLAILMIPAVSPALRHLIVIGVRPGVLAALLVFIATAVVAGAHASTISRFGALACLAAAVLLCPASLPALLLTLGLMVLLRDLGDNLPPAVRSLVGLAMCVTGLACILSLWLTPQHWTGLLGNLPLDRVGLTTVDWVLFGTATVLMLAAVARPWLRAPAMGVVALAVTAGLSAPARLDLLAIALPFAVVVSAATVEELLAGYRRLVRWRTRSRRSRLAVAATTVLAVLLAATVALADVPRVRLPSAARSVVSWFASEVPADETIAVDDRIWSALIVAGVPPKRLQRSLDGAAWWVTATPVIMAGWPEYAAFGTGANALHISRRQSAVGTEGDQARRSSVGGQLALNPSLQLALTAADELRAGHVDLRIMFVLAQLAPKIPLTISDFPAAPGERIGTPPLRRILITQVNGRPATESEGSKLVQNWLDGQVDRYKPCGIDANDAGLLVRYCVAPPLP